MKMTIALEVLFWLSVCALVYTYIGYPTLLVILGTFRARPVRKERYTPSVSVIIAAYDEERALSAKLENTLALDYPGSHLEIIVTSDCSTDRTDEIARSFASKGVRLQRSSERLGKTAAQNAAVEQASGDIIVFSDATTYYKPDVLRVMMPSFADPGVGCVTGQLIYSSSVKTAVGHGTRSYWNYELLLRRYESAIGSLIGVCGCMYAVRKSAYLPLYHEACSDFVIATIMVQQGLRAVYEPKAICLEEPNTQAHKELAVRVRIITQTFADLWRNRAMMNPLRHGLYSIELFSHKVMRYLTPVFLLLTLFFSGMLILKSKMYAGFFAAQLGFYAIAVLSPLFERVGVKARWILLPQYFLLGNLASLIAFMKVIRGERYIKWEPVRPSLNADVEETAPGIGSAGRSSQACR